MGMEKETIDVKVNVEDYFSKMNPEDSAIIAQMCLSKLTSKVEELKDLYASLAKTYGFEMGVCGITCIAQVSAKPLEMSVTNTLGTKEGIEHALLTLTDRIAKQVADIKKEASNDKE